MGYLRHKALIVTGYNHDLEPQHTDILLVLETRWPDWTRLLSPVISGMANGQASFMFAPDGSKEGWDTSNEGDLIIQTIKDMLDRSGTLDWVEIVIGGDDGEAAIADTNLESDTEADPNEL